MWEQIRANKRKSVFLIVLMALVLSLLGGVIGEFYFPGVASTGQYTPGGGALIGMAIALVIWFFMSLFAYFAGSKMVLASSGATKSRSRIIRSYLTSWKR